MKEVTVLIPTYKRPNALAVTLTSLCFQGYKNFDIVISDQSEEDCLSHNASFETAVRLLETKGHAVTIFKNLPVRGMAQQRQFLLEKSVSPLSLFIDDDLILEPYVVGNMVKVIEEEQCGFVGSAVIGLSFRNDFRPEQEPVDFWEDGVMSEIVRPGSKEWERYKLHNAANLYHVQEKLKASPDAPLPYKVAWVGGCVLYNTQKLINSGGFRFWEELPQKHCGEDVLAELRVMQYYGGCGIMPSGVYHQELKTMVKERGVNAPEYLEI